MAAKFEYVPRIAPVIAMMDIPERQKAQIIALLEKRDRDLEDFLAQVDLRLQAGGL